MSQDSKESGSQPGSSSHRPRAASCRATAAWCTDSGSDDSRRWSDQLSLDEKDGFIFVNYSEGQTRAHLQGPLIHPHPNLMEVRNYSKLKPGNLDPATVYRGGCKGLEHEGDLTFLHPTPSTWATCRGFWSCFLGKIDSEILTYSDFAVCGFFLKKSA